MNNYNSSLSLNAHAVPEGFCYGILQPNKSLESVHANLRLSKKYCSHAFLTMRTVLEWENTIQLGEIKKDFESPTSI